MDSILEWIGTNIGRVGIGAIVLLCLALVVVAIWKFVRLIAWTTRRTRDLVPGAGLLSIACGMLAVAALVPQPLIVMARLVLILGRMLVYDLPFWLVLLWVQTADCRSSPIRGACGPLIGQAASEVWQGPIAKALGLVGEAPSPLSNVGATAKAAVATPAQVMPLLPTSFAEDLVRAVAVYLAVVIALRCLAILWQRTSPAEWHQVQVLPGLKILTLAGSLLLALYLCVAAIVAIPVFNDRTDQVDAGSKQLRDQLPKLADLYAKGLHTPVPPESAVDITTLRQHVEERIAAQTQSPEYRRYYLAFISQEVDAWHDSRNALDARESEFGEKAEQFRERVVQYFAQQNTMHVNGQLTLQHETALVGKYGEWLAEYTAQLERCRDLLLKQRSDLAVMISQISQAADNPAMFMALSPRDTHEVEMEQVCGTIVPAFDDYLVPRQDVAASLLLFGQALRWLLLTESRALALIVGLLGFGFFGALTASFIRGVRGGTVLAGADIVVPAMIRGVAAAILIFLATFGGVAVFTRAEPEPNAYAVFFTCFIAAVFSEDVWAWAQRQQSAQFGKTNGDGQTPAKREPEADPAGPAPEGTEAPPTQNADASPPAAGDESEGEGDATKR